MYVIVMSCCDKADMVDGIPLKVNDPTWVPLPVELGVTNGPLALLCEYCTLWTFKVALP